MFFLFVLNEVYANGCLKILESSEKSGIKERRVNILCLEGCIEENIKFENAWSLLKNTEKPKVGRIYKFRDRKRIVFLRDKICHLKVIYSM